MDEGEDVDEVNGEGGRVYGWMGMKVEATETRTSRDLDKAKDSDDMKTTLMP